MIRLLKIQWIKLRRYKTFWFYLGIYVFVFSVCAYVASSFMNSLGFGVEGSVESGEDLAMQYWEPLSWMARWMSFLLGWFLLSLISAELTDRTYRQNLMDGLSRFEVFLSHSLLVLFLATLVLAMVVVNGTLIAGWPSDHFAVVKLLGALSLQTMFSLFFACFIAQTIKKVVNGILVLTLVPMMLEPFIGALVDRATQGEWSRFFPFKVMGGIGPSLNPSGQDSVVEPWVYVLASIYLVFLMLANYYRTRTINP